MGSLAHQNIADKNAKIHALLVIIFTIKTTANLINTEQVGIYYAKP